MNDIQKIKNFENIIDEELKKQLSSIPLSCEEITELFLYLYESAILEISKRGASNSSIKQTAAFFKRCLEVALPYFIDKPKTEQSSVKYHGRKKLLNTLDFLNNYYIIRELLYYTIIRTSLLNGVLRIIE